MFGHIDTMRMARELGAHASQRHRLTASNVANADTPGYRAADLGQFEGSTRRTAVGLRTTSAAHVSAGDWGSAHGARRIDAGGEPSPNGNTVSLEDELIRAADAKRQFDLSLTVMQSGMSLVRTAIGRRS